ncbi:Golgi-resident adenosine 3',5'-bisphosphate 3'-phosphatase [Callorhinchus milii]|uniref:3'(2'), 5'-bisphosphate nucleotidase 2 n=1 Tax=Callorhinchus milii TaxID=7868 RepID=A0A4W3JE59_CALMI|nr:Golgi-resident adenosine 3',5'-bisphosphate 3'-phosphatase [Callorhinchus milii]|eukprot:gi/632939404/ref/XP_007909927.1/ PREDICTED: inositol monophosphatase 3-like [Callorhinchus milii]
MAPMGIKVSHGRVAVCLLLAAAALYIFCVKRGMPRASSISIFSSPSDSDSGGPSLRIDLRQLLSLSIAAAEEGGRAVKEVKEKRALDEKSKGKTKEGAEEMVTAGDLMSHRKMASLFANAFPNVKVISEEHDDTKLDKTLVWNSKVPSFIEESIVDAKMVPAESITVWIDPLDATQEYTEDLRHFVTTMVCVAVDGKPVIGVIHKPFSKYTAWAMVGGASNVHKRKSYNEKSPTVIVSRSHAGTVKSYSTVAFGNGTSIIPAGGAGYKVLSLLDIEEASQLHHADLYIHVTFIKKWDICAGNAILEALGGHMTTIEGGSIDYKDSPSNSGGLVATVGMDHEALLKKLPGLTPKKDPKTP